MSLQDRLDAFKADFEAGKLGFKPGPEALDIMHRATAELIATGQAPTRKKAGDKAPEFTLNDPDGKPVSSRELLAQGTAGGFVLSRRLVPLLQSGTAGAAGGVAGDHRPRRQPRRHLAADAPNSRKSQRDNKLGFPILSDEKSRVGDRVRHPLRAAGLSDRALQGLQERSARVQRRSGLGAADAGALHHRHRRHHRLCRGQSRLHAASRSFRSCCRCSTSCASPRRPE